MVASHGVGGAVVTIYTTSKDSPWGAAPLVGGAPCTCRLMMRTARLGMVFPSFSKRVSGVSIFATNPGINGRVNMGGEHIRSR